MNNIFKRLFKGKNAVEHKDNKEINIKTENAVLIKDLKDNSLYNMKSLKADRVRTVFNVVTIADCHGTLKEKELWGITTAKPDIVLLLGDNDLTDLTTAYDYIRKAAGDKVPLLAVTGNHDDKNLLQQFEGQINDLHQNIYLFDMIKFGGFGGSIRYKPDTRRTMFTNKESEEMLDALPQCDILITHDKPNFGEASSDELSNAHAGLTGIGKYIREKSPAIVLHGHLHDKYVERYNSTLIRCCYRVECFRISI